MTTSLSRRSGQGQVAGEGEGEEEEEEEGTRVRLRRDHDDGMVVTLSQPSRSRRGCRKVAREGGARR